MLMEDVGEQFLEELMDRSLVQVGRRDYTGTNVKTCRIHDLLRDLCIEKAREENFLEIIHLPLIGNDVDSVDVALAKPKLRRIAIHPSERYVCLKGEYPKLRSLLLFQNEKSIKFEISKYKSFIFLRVLKLVKKDVDEWRVSSEIGNLYHLRYLKLEGRSRIMLPQSIGRLKSLYTLYLVCPSSVVPNVVFKLECLCHISLNHVNTVPSWISSSKYIGNFETLKNILVDEKFVENTGVVRRMSNIKRLGLVFKTRKDVKSIITSLIELHRLASLKLDFFYSSIRVFFGDLEPLSQCHGLTKLKIVGKLHQRHHDDVLKFLPSKIVQLTLSLSGIKQDPMGVLEKLPRLRILRLGSHAYKGSKMICSANGFPQLDSLEMWSLYKLEEWEIEEGTMPRLRSLHLNYISRLKKLPEGLRYITTLQEMKLIGMSSLEERVKGRDEDFLPHNTFMEERPR